MAFIDDSASIGSSEYSLPADSTSLAAQTDDCQLEVWIDPTPITAADEFEWKQYEKVNGGTQRVAFSGRLIGPYTENMRFGPWLVGDGWDFTLKKIAGTDRTIAWSLRKLSLVGGRLDTNTGSMSSGVVDAVAVATDAVTEIAAGVWDRLTSALTTVGSIGKLLVDNINATITSRASQTSVDDVDNYVDTEVATLITKVDAVKVDTAAILDDTGTSGVVVSSTSRDAIRDAILNFAMGTLTIVKLIRGFAAVLLGKLSGGGTATETFRDPDDTKDVVVGTVDSSGNRTNVALDLDP